MVIRVLDYVTQCSTYADGDVIFNLIAPPLERGETVTLSFEGILAVPSAFVNAAVVRLVERVSISDVKDRLKIVDSTRDINDLVRNRFAHLSSAH